MSEQGSTCEGELRPSELQRGVLLVNQSMPSPGSLLGGFPKEKLPTVTQIWGQCLEIGHPDKEYSRSSCFLEGNDDSRGLKWES